MELTTHFNQFNAAKTAVMIDGLQISYGRLAADVSCLEVWLVNQGVIVGQRIGVFIRNPYWSWVSCLVAMRLGLSQITFVPRNFHEQTAAAGLLDIVIGEFEEIDGSEVARKVIVFSPETLAPFAEQFAIATDYRCKTDPLASARAEFIMLTSGTTGRPRVVALSSEMIRARLKVLQDSQGLTSDTILLSTAGSNTMPGFAYSMACLQAGGCIVFTTSRDNLRRHSINLLVTTPAELHILLSLSPQPWENKDTLKIIVAGGRLPIPLRDDALARICCRLSIDYGATETNCTATGDVKLLDRHSGAVGFAVAGASIQVVDGQGRRQPPGKEGVVRTSTSYMVLGYGVDQGCKAADVFRDGWFYPGDLGILFEDGLLAITGRISETLNIGGTKVPLLDFEAPLEAYPGLQDVCVIVLSLDAVDRLGILVVCDDAVDLQGLTQQIATLLPGRMRFNLLRVANIPRNAMGKIPRNELSRIYSEIFRRETAMKLNKQTCN